jgi:hypothetical protein
MYWLHEEPNDFFRWTPHALKCACAEAGLEILDLQRIGGGPEVVSDILSKLTASRSPRMGVLVCGLLSRLLKLKAVTKLSKRPKFALGYLLIASRPSEMKQTHRAY